jgi:hypothetical protein
MERRRVWVQDEQLGEGPSLKCTANVVGELAGSQVMREFVQGLDTMRAAAVTMILGCATVFGSTGMQRFCRGR